MNQGTQENQTTAYDEQMSSINTSIENVVIKQISDNEFCWLHGDITSKTFLTPLDTLINFTNYLLTSFSSAKEIKINYIKHMIDICVDDDWDSNGYTHLSQKVKTLMAEFIYDEIQKSGDDSSIINGKLIFQAYACN